MTTQHHALIKQRRQVQPTGVCVQFFALRVGNLKFEAKKHTNGAILVPLGPTDTTTASQPLACVNQMQRSNLVCKCKLVRLNERANANVDCRNGDLGVALAFRVFVSCPLVRLCLCLGFAGLKKKLRYSCR